jgi:hypothetical protein
MISSTAEKPWSEIDIADLKRLADVSVPIEEITDILLREVRQKAAKLNSDPNPSA